jgi:hypothetical protein
MLNFLCSDCILFGYGRLLRVLRLSFVLYNIHLELMPNWLGMSYCIHRNSCYYHINRLALFANFKPVDSTFGANCDMPRPLGVGHRFVIMQRISIAMEGLLIARFVDIKM